MKKTLTSFNIPDDIKIEFKSWLIRNDIFQGDALVCFAELVVKDKAISEKIIEELKHKKGKVITPEVKRSAQNIMALAIQRGKLNRKSCEVCGDANTDGHHRDYLKPLEVVWLCRKHHKAEHKKN